MGHGKAARYFADADRTLATAVSPRWPQGIHCPTCGRTDVRFILTRRIWECKEKYAKRQFSAKVGPPDKGTPWSIDDQANWLQAAAQIFRILYKGGGEIVVTVRKSGQ